MARSNVTTFIAERFGCGSTSHVSMTTSAVSVAPVRRVSTEGYPSGSLGGDDLRLEVGHRRVELRQPVRRRNTSHRNVTADEHLQRHRDLVAAATTAFAPIGVRDHLDAPRLLRDQISCRFRMRVAGVMRLTELMTNWP